MSEGLLEVRLTGEPVTITGRSIITLPLRQPLELRALLERLGREAHPWFYRVLAGDGTVADTGHIMLLLDGKRLELPRDASHLVAGGVLYLIAPISGG